MKDHTRVLIFLFLFISSATLLADEINHDKSLADKIIEFHKTLTSDKRNERLQAFKELLPQKTDFQILFPKHGQDLWELYAGNIDMMLKNADKAISRYTKNKLLKMTTVNLRVEDIQELYQDAIKLIPKNVPVYRIVCYYESRSSGSSAYLFVNKRWVLIRGFEGIPKAIKKIIQIKEKGDYKKSLAEALAQFHLAIDAKDKKDQILALKNILPAENDYKTLFAEYGNELWKLAEPSYNELLIDIDNLAKRVKEENWTDTKYKDLRKDKKVFGDVIRLLPKDLPAFQVEKIGPKGSIGFNTFLYIKHRWVLINGLKEIPKTVEELKKAKAEKEKETKQKGETGKDNEETE